MTRAWRPCCRLTPTVAMTSTTRLTAHERVRASATPRASSGRRMISAGTKKIQEATSAIVAAPGRPAPRAPPASVRREPTSGRCLDASLRGAKSSSGARRALIFSRWTGATVAGLTLDALSRRPRRANQSRSPLQHPAAVGRDPMSVSQTGQYSRTAGSYTAPRA